MFGSGKPMVPALSSIVSVVMVMAATGEHSVCPNTMVKGAPSFCSSEVTSAAGTVEPPEQIAFVDDRSVVAKDGCSSMATSIVGTPIIAFPRYVSNSSSTSPGSKASSSTCVAALDTAPITQQTQPPVWNSGMVVMNTSPGSIPIRSAVSAPLLARPRWCNSAPFGKPVVPDVYWIITGSLGLTAGSTMPLSSPAAMNADHSSKQMISR